MITPIQLILILFILFALSRAWLRYNEKKISVLEFAFWLVVWVAAIIAVISPGTIGYVSKFFGIGRPADLILYTAVLLLFYLVFRVYVAIDSVHVNLTKIAREIAIKNKRKK